MYVTIRMGDRLPTVALAQSRMMTLGLSAGVDGVFGRETQNAVKRFQEHNNLAPSGAITRVEWALLFTGTPLVSVDHIDAGDLFVLQEDGPHLDDGASTVVTSYGQSNGLNYAIDRIVSGQAAGSVSLLRFHGHGSPGHMVVTGGQRAGASTSFLGEAYQQNRREYTERYARLGTIMKRTGSIELHGCNVGSGRRGEALLRGLADACHVPVSAGRRQQTGERFANRFEGPVRTVCPGGVSLASWAARLLGIC